MRYNTICISYYAQYFHIIIKIFFLSFSFHDDVYSQEYLDDLYEVARSRDDPLLLESLENFLSATVDNLLQKQADNERLDAALKQ